MNGNKLPRSDRTVRDYLRAAEALSSLAVARVFVAVAPFRWTVAMVRRWPESKDDGASVDTVVQALDRASRVAPFRAKCFERALAGHWMMGRRGIPTQLHYGIRGVKGQDLEAHVWLSCADRVVLGAETMEPFAEVAKWPGDHASPRG